MGQRRPRLVREAMIEIAGAGIDDLPEVMGLAAKISEAAQWNAAAYAEYAGKGNGFQKRVLLVARQGGEVAGFVAGNFLQGEDAAELENLAVDVAWRRNGVANALCTALAVWAGEQGAKGLILEVRQTNVAAQKLYERLGFVMDGRRPEYYQDPREDGLLMRWSFGQAMQDQDL